MSVNLATQLREGTKKAHTNAESTGFVKCFLKGVVEKTSYRNLVKNLYFVYSAMEEEMQRHREDRIISKIYFPELNRKQSLEQDLKFYYGAGGDEQIAPSTAGSAYVHRIGDEQIAPSTAGKAYVQRIREISEKEPELLVAHSYTRYLGDLSGGQILKKIAKTAMNLDAEGTAFYEFTDIPDEKAFKNNYRQAMNNLPIDQETADRIVNEANAAFDMNMQIFRELEGNLIMAIGKLLFYTFTGKRRVVSTELTTATE